MEFFNLLEFESFARCDFKKRDLTLTFCSIQQNKFCTLNKDIENELSLSLHMKPILLMRILNHFLWFKGVGICFIFLNRGGTEGCLAEGR